MADWFSPEDLMSLRGMEWLSRKIALETISGQHTGKRLGQGTDFSQYRTYMPGDDLRMIDWKVYARTDRLFLKESELESRSRCYGLLDASASMKYEEARISKWQYASVLWTALSYLSGKQGDLNGIALLNDQQVQHRPPQAGNENARLKMLFETQPAGCFPQTLQLPLLKAGFSHRFVLITDLYEQSQELGAFIRSLLPERHEVTVFHVMGKQEIELDYPDITLFEDAETGQQVETDTRQIRSAYQRDMEAFLTESRNQILKWGANYQLCRMPDSPVGVLKAYFKTKSGRNNVAIR